MQQGEKIRVLRIINRFNLGGPTFNVAYLTAYMDERFETRLVGGMKDATEASSSFILEGLGIEPVVVAKMQRSVSPLRDLKAYREIREQIKAFKPHIVHTHASKAGALGRLAAIHEGVPVVLHTFHGHVFHSYFGKLKTLFYKNIEQWLAKRSTRIIAISGIQKYELSEVHQIEKPDKIEVVPLGFDLERFNTDQAVKRDRFRTRFQLQENEVAIGIVGRLVPIKNHTMFLNAVKTLYKKHHHARFFIIGDGESRQDLLHYCDQEKIPFEWKKSPSSAAPLCFTSWIKEVEDVMAGLDIVVLTSLNEGTPVSLIEAQSAAKPIVSTRVGGIEDVVVENGSAFLCDVQAQTVFNDHLERLITQPEKRSAMGKIGRAHVNHSFSYKRLVDDMQSLYLRLINEKNL
jgi:glycosyltransferase involved in cell wall biosynthesis